MRRGDANSNKYNKRKINAVQARAFYSLPSTLSLCLSLFVPLSGCIKAHSTFPPAQWRPPPPHITRPHLENCNFHAKLVHMQRSAVNVAAGCGSSVDVEKSSTGSTGDPLAHFSTETRDRKRNTRLRQSASHFCNPLAP